MWFSLSTCDWLFPCNTITFHRYYWCLWLFVSLGNTCLVAIENYSFWRPFLYSCRRHHQLKSWVENEQWILLNPISLRLLAKVEYGKGLLGLQIEVFCLVTFLFVLMGSIIICIYYHINNYIILYSKLLFSFLTPISP